MHNIARIKKPFEYPNENVINVICRLKRTRVRSAMHQLRQHSGHCRDRNVHMIYRCNIAPPEDGRATFQTHRYESVARYVPPFKRRRAR